MLSRDVVEKMQQLPRKVHEVFLNYRVKIGKIFAISFKLITALQIYYIY